MEEEDELDSNAQTRRSRSGRTTSAVNYNEKNDDDEERAEEEEDAPKKKKAKTTASGKSSKAKEDVDLGDWGTSGGTGGCLLPHG